MQASFFTQYHDPVKRQEDKLTARVTVILSLNTGSKKTS